MADIPKYNVPMEFNDTVKVGGHLTTEAGGTHAGANTYSGTSTHNSTLTAASTFHAEANVSLSGSTFVRDPASLRYCAPLEFSASGLTLPNNSSEVTFVAGDHGKIYNCDLAGSTKKLTLPANAATAVGAGWQITIYQTGLLANSGIIQINANTGNIFASSSIGIGAGSFRRANGTTNNHMCISGSDTNGVCAAGSKIVITAGSGSAGQGKYHVTAELLPVGNGASGKINFYDAGN